MLSVTRQCELLGVSRASLYYQPRGPSPQELRLCRLLDEQYTRTPFYGSRRMTVVLRAQGYPVGRKYVAALMRQMGLSALYPKPRLSLRSDEHKVYPYLLRELAVVRPRQVFCADITYVPMRRGFMYLMAVLDWFSRYVVSYRVSNSLDSGFCLEALREALSQARPEIFNTDQGAQFTSSAFVGELLANGVRVSMDGRGRALDNVFIERLWRSVKYEEVYLKDYETMQQGSQSLREYLHYYNTQRPHQALGYKTPQEVYRDG